MAACVIAVQPNGGETPSGNPPFAFDLVIAIMIAALGMVLMMLIKCGRRASKR